MDPACYCDMDGLLTNFAETAIKFHDQVLHPADIEWDFPQQIGWADTWCPTFWEPLANKAFWEHLPWTAEGKDLLKGLEEIFGTNIAILSNPLDYDNVCDGKRAWVKRELPSYSKRLLLGSAKGLTASSRHILLDDYDGNVDTFRAQGGRAVLVPRTWNSRKSETDSQGRFDTDKILLDVRKLL